MQSLPDIICNCIFFKGFPRTEEELELCPPVELLFGLRKYHNIDNIRHRKVYSSALLNDKYTAELFKQISSSLLTKGFAKFSKLMLQIVNEGNFLLLQCCTYYLESFPHQQYYILELQFILSWKFPTQKYSFKTAGKFRKKLLCTDRFSEQLLCQEQLLETESWHQNNFL